MTPEDAFWTLHAGLPQQGPGSDASTRRALALAPDLPARPRVLDLGCGPGRQTLALARATGGDVLAVDRHAPFLEELRARADAAGLGERIATRCDGMLGLDADGGTFDLVWSEGAIYAVGFEAGLRDWRRLLAPRGVVAVTECTWLTRAHPDAARAFFEAAYPAMQDEAANRRAAEACGYELLGSFTLPEADWRDYYDPLQRRIERLRALHDDPTLHAVLEQTRHEVEVFDAREGSFGYVFYVMRLTE